MKYLLLLAEDPAVWESASDDAVLEYHRAHMAFHRAVRERGTLIVSEALAGVESATTVRHVDGNVTLTDGPFAETVEHVAGFYLIDAPDLDTVTEACALLPPSYAIEIRPVVTIEVSDG